tara:strand:- start:101 stop:430 length:330 start_codon:yes stop_codon:yes gene_type:complete
MEFRNRRWLVIPTNIINDINFNEVLESGTLGLRKSIDQSKTFVKYQVNVVINTHTEVIADPETGEEISNTVEAGVYGRPSIYKEEYPEYTYSEIKELLQTDEWLVNDME